MRDLFAIGFACLAVLSASATAAQDDAMATVAAAVRDKGFACDEPQSLKPDPKATAPDEEAWIIRCENGAYQVKFMGDRGAEVQPVSE